MLWITSVADKHPHMNNQKPFRGSYPQVSWALQAALCCHCPAPVGAFGGQVQAVGTQPALHCHHHRQGRLQSTRQRCTASSEGQEGAGSQCPSSKCHHVQVKETWHVLCSFPCAICIPRSNEHQSSTFLPPCTHPASALPAAWNPLPCYLVVGYHMQCVLLKRSPCSCILRCAHHKT